MAGLRPKRRFFGSVRGPNCHPSQGPCMSLAFLDIDEISIWFVSAKDVTCLLGSSFDSV